ncbi:MAG: NUDIX domain-containing protein [Candidatus Paceibacterota bacterium]
MTCIVSPSRVLLVKDESKHDPLWKLPGGSVESDDADIIAAAIRETKEETGIQLLPGELRLLLKARSESGVYYPNFFVAHVSEDKLDTRAKVAYESGDPSQPMKVGVFNREEVPMMPDLLERHRRALQQAVA